MLKKNTILIVIILLSGVTATFVQGKYEVMKIASESMHPTLGKGDRVLVKRVSKKASVARGELVVYRRYDDSEAPKLWLHRVVGLPGEEIQFKNQELWIDDAVLESEFAYHSIPDFEFGGQQLSRFKSPQNNFFVLGDNSLNSYDSRYFGFVNRDDIVGRVEMVVWPPSHWKKFLN